jgi:cytochrome c556
MHIDVVARRLVFVIASTSCCLLGSTLAIADAHSDRQALMQANKTAVGVIDTVVIGQLNTTKVKDQAKILIANGAKILQLFGPDTDQSDPAVKPTIWTDAAGFKAADDKFVNDTKVLMTSPDRVAFATALVGLQADCTACHQAYRVAPAPAPVVARAAAPAPQVVATATQAPADGGAQAPANGAAQARPNRAAAAANQGGGFVDRAPAPPRAAPTVKLKEPSVDLEIDAAQIAARSGSRNIGQVDLMHNRSQRAINCLEGPKGADFVASVPNPCEASGNGVIPDTTDAAKKAKFQEVVEKLKSVLTITDRTEALQGNLDAADMIVAAGGH